MHTKKKKKLCRTTENANFFIRRHPMHLHMSLILCNQKHTAKQLSNLNDMRRMKSQPNAAAKFLIAFDLPTTVSEQQRIVCIWTWTAKKEIFWKFLEVDVRMMLFFLLISTRCRWLHGRNRKYSAGQICKGHILLHFIYKLAGQSVLPFSQICLTAFYIEKLCFHFRGKTLQPQPLNYFILLFLLICSAHSKISE